MSGAIPPFQAFLIRQDENRKVHYDVDKCWGCTICAPSCPKHAIHLLPREQKA